MIFRSFTLSTLATLPVPLEALRTVATMEKDEVMGFMLDAPQVKAIEEKYRFAFADLPMVRNPILRTSRGLGDTLAKITKATGIDAVVRVIEKITGKKCGCQGRIERCNKAVPYQQQ